MEKTQIEVIENSPAAMIQAAVQSGADLGKLEQLLTLQERWEANEAKKAYNSSMVEVHQKITAVVKTKINPQTRSKYAELDQVIMQTKEVYAPSGFSVSFYEGDNAPEGNVRVCADVIHKLGHSCSYHHDVPLDGVGIKGNANMTAIHGKASSISYGRRYLLCMIFNIPTIDDNDGNNSKIETIEEKQAITISEYLKTLNIDKKKFLDFFKIESIDQMPKSKYNEAIVMLKTKEGKK